MSILANVQDFLSRKFGVEWGFPSKEDAEKFRDHILKRYIDKNLALTYMERVIDRMINKARGILPFNAILIALIGVEIARITVRFQFLIYIIGYFSLMLLTLSSVILMSMFWVHWGNVDHYVDFVDEVNETANVIKDRSHLLQISIVCSLASIGCAVILAIIALIGLIFELFIPDSMID